MKNNTSTLVRYFKAMSLVFAVFSFLFISSIVHAYIIPTFSFTQPNVYSTQIKVSGDPNSVVTLHYGNLASLSNVIGTTDDNGSLVVSVSSSSYSIACGNTAYVYINGVQSATIPWAPVDSTCTSLSLSQTSLSLIKGQSTSVTSPNNSNISVTSNSNSSIVSSNVIGNTIYLTAMNYGTASLIVCSNDNANLCGTISITVTSDTASIITFSQKNVILIVGDSQTITIYGSGLGTYYVSGNTSTASLTASISGNTVNLYGLLFGSSTVTICQNNGGCGVMYVSVVNGIQTQTQTPVSNVTTEVPSNTVSPVVVKTDSIKKFITNLKLGSKGAEVKSLQSKLKTLKFYLGTLDGKFGASTEKAVKAFQKSHKLEQSGNTGPKTRALLNK